MWEQLTANLAVVALLVSGWTHAQHWLDESSERLRRIAFASMMGAGTVASMLLSVELKEGIFFDLRAALIAAAGLFGGVFAALAAGGIAAVCRVLLGGSVWIGLVVIAIAVAIGLIGHLYIRRREVGIGMLAAFAAAVAATPWISFALTHVGSAAGVRAEVVLPATVLNFIGTFVVSVVIMQSRRWALERQLVKAALIQAPDYQYVKNLGSEFVAVNQAVAIHNGFSSPDQMKGLSDLDIAGERGRTLFDAEQRLIDSGGKLVDFEELVVDGSGASRWFLTSKSALKDADGTVIGLAGVTRDISYRKRLETELQVSRDQFSYALQEMSDGLAMFDERGFLIFCNDQYRNLFPLTSHVRVPGTHIRQILSAIVETREQRGIPARGAEGWIESVANALGADAEQRVSLFDGRWLRIRTRPTREGKSMVVVSDITQIKQAEAATTDQLKRLAGTDGLTGLVNRRAFDEALSAAFARASRENRPLGLLLIDVDHFKAFNDHYGHPAGDDCLRTVARVLRKKIRKGDVAARYGGEEFAVVLAGTDDGGAAVAAENLRAALRKLALPHAGSDKGIVTASIGVSSALPSAPLTSAELIRRADEALYRAKASGRDRVHSWSAGEPQANAPSTEGTGRSAA